MVIAEPFEPHISWLPVMVPWKQLMMKFFLEFFPHFFFYLLIYYDFLKQTYFSYFFRCIRLRTMCNGQSRLKSCSTATYVRDVIIECAGVMPSPSFFLHRLNNLRTYYVRCSCMLYDERAMYYSSTSTVLHLHRTLHASVNQSCWQLPILFLYTFIKVTFIIQW